MGKETKQRSYTAEYRADAVRLSEEIGASAAARQLKISPDTLYTWRNKAKNGELELSTIPVQPKNALNIAQRMKELEQENKMLRSELTQTKKENQILEDAAAFFVARRKKSGSV